MDLDFGDQVGTCSCTLKSSPFEIIMLGASSVGKTSLLLRYVSNQFDSDIEATPGATFLTKSLFLENSLVRLHIWDVSGQQRFQKLCQTYLKNCKAVVMVYSIEDRESFEIAKTFVEYHRMFSPNIILALIGNKADKEENRAVTYEEAKDYALKHKLIFRETSAKTNENMDDIFRAIAAALVGNVCISVAKPKNHFCSFL